MSDIKEEGRKNLHDMNENIEHIIQFDEILDMTLRELESLIDLAKLHQETYLEMQAVKFKNKVLRRKRELLIDCLDEQRDDHYLGDCLDEQRDETNNEL